MPPNERNENEKSVVGLRFEGPYTLSFLKVKHAVDTDKEAVN